MGHSGFERKFLSSSLFRLALSSWGRRYFALWFLTGKGNAVLAGTWISGLSPRVQQMKTSAWDDSNHWQGNADLNCACSSWCLSKLLQDIKVLSHTLSPRWMSVSVCSGFRLLIDLVPWEQKHWKSSWLMTGHSLQRMHQAGPPRSMSSWACGNSNSKALTSHSVLARSQGSLGSPVVLSHQASYSACPETLLRTNCFAVFRCPVYNQNIRRRQGWYAIRLRTAAM